MTKTILLIATVCLALAVIVGAFGAHGLKAHVSPEMMAVYKTGVEYHFYHALGLLLLGILATHFSSRLVHLAAWFLFGGIVLFSGSLYLLAITGLKIIGIITPIGGLCFIVGWVLAFFAILKGWKK